MYSQNNEEQVVLDYFKGECRGNFLDIGANDGQTLSNTRALAELGWSGVCVEPSLKAFEKLKELYKDNRDVYTYNFAIGHTNKKQILYDMGSHLGNDSGLLATLVEEEKKRWPGQKYEEVEVKCFKWKTFLNRLRIKEFDFISIDTEGMELVILEQMDLSKVRCACVEFNGRNKEKFDKIFEGFNLIYTSPENLIYAR